MYVDGVAGLLQSYADNDPRQRAHRPQDMHGNANLATTEALEAEQGQRTFTYPEQNVNPLAKWSNFVTY